MSCEVDLPGFRFHPTEEELVDFYLKNMVLGKTPSFCVIGMLNIYRHDPWELPGLASIMGEREWYFFVPRDRKQGGAGRPNRTTETGFWKATGSDRKVMKSSSSDHNHKQRLIGLRKTLVFYMGRAPRGTKTDWVMNEYRLLPDNSPMSKEEVVVCKIYRKATSMKVLEQRAAAIDEASNTLQVYSSSTTPLPASTIDTDSLSIRNEEDTAMKKESNPIVNGSLNNPKTITTTSLKLPSENEQLPQLQLPRLTSDWTQDSFWTQFNSPWLQNLIASPNLLMQ